MSCLGLPIWQRWAYPPTPLTEVGLVLPCNLAPRPGGLSTENLGFSLLFVSVTLGGDHELEALN